MDTLDEAKALLRRRHAEASAEVKRLEDALAALDALDVAPSQTPTVVGPRPSVRTMLMALLEEGDRDWSVGEVLAEYQDRGTPVHGQDPSNALRAAMADAKKKRMVVSTDVGRYKASKWQTTNQSDNVLVAHLGGPPGHGLVEGAAAG